MGRVFSDDDFVDSAPAGRFDMRTGQRPSLDPLDAAIQRRAAQQAKAAEGPGFVESGLRGAGQGVVGMGDEMAGSSASYGVGGFGLPGLSLGGVRRAAIEREQAGDPTGTKTYEAVRDESRVRDEQAAESNPLAYYPGMLGASLALPVPTAAKGAGFGTRLATNVAGGAAASGVTGIGQSDAENPVDIAKDAGKAALLGGGLSGVATTVGAPFKWAYDKLGKSAPTRIANEAAEGATQMTTPTARAHLANAKEGLADEVIKGPRGDEVHAALRGPAAEAPAKLKPRLDDLKAQRNAGYQAFRDAGRGEVPMDDYLAQLRAKADEADVAGDTEMFHGIGAFADEVEAAYKRKGVMDLERLRKMTTKTQRAAASAIGGLNLHAPAELKQKLSAVATDAMDETLGAAAAGDEVLEAAAASVRESNKGMSPLLTAKKALKQRANKEASEGGGFRRMGKQMAVPTLAAGIGAATGEDEEKLTNMATYGLGGFALQKGLPALGGLMDRGITTAAKLAARNPNSRLPELAGRAVRPFVPPLSLNLMDAYTKRKESGNGRR